MTVQAGICDRTQAIQDAIVTAINATPAVMCNTVTQAQLDGITELDLSTASITDLTLQPGDFDLLTGLTTLNLSNTGLSTLPSGIFSDLEMLQTLNLSNNAFTALTPGIFGGLSALTTLNLSNNAFTALPEGIFSDLATALTTLDVSGNPGAPFTLTPTLTRLSGSLGQQSYMLAVEIPQGVPFEVTMTAQIEGESSMSLMIDTGERQTSSFTYNNQGTITVSFSTAIPATYTGVALSDSVIFNPICGRTLQVRTTILQAINNMGGSTLCQEVTVAQLGMITELDFSSLASSELALRDLRSGDFADLTGLTSLDFSGNELTTSGLPADIFAGLTTLQTLNLSNNDLTELPAGIFSGLGMLQGVDVSGNTTDPFTLTVTSRITLAPSGNTPGTAVIEVVEGVPFTSFTATVSITGGTFPNNTSTVTISKGETQSDSFGYTEDNDPDTDTRITVSSPMALDDSGNQIDIAGGFASNVGYSGFQLDSDEEIPVMGSVNICERTAQVETEILAKLGLFDNNIACMTVPSDDLAGITILNLSDSTTADDTYGRYYNLAIRRLRRSERTANLDFV